MFHSLCNKKYQFLSDASRLENLKGWRWFWTYWEAGLIVFLNYVSTSPFPDSLIRGNWNTITSWHTHLPPPFTLNVFNYYCGIIKVCVIRIGTVTMNSTGFQTWSVFNPSLHPSPVLWLQFLYSWTQTSQWCGSVLLFLLFLLLVITRLELYCYIQSRGTCLWYAHTCTTHTAYQTISHIPRTPLVGPFTWVQTVIGLGSNSHPQQGKPAAWETLCPGPGAVQLGAYSQSEADLERNDHGAVSHWS